jgi:hypothetical protein
MADGFGPYSVDSNGVDDMCDLQTLGQQHAQWNQAPGLDGDPYRDPEEVSRGLTITAGHGFDGSSHGGPMCYDMSAAVYPGLGDPQCFGMLGPDPYEVGPQSHGSRAANTNEEAFAETTAVPRDVPKDDFFRLATTTVLVMATITSPGAIGNVLLRFLREQVQSSITKVTIEKFAIKADVFVPEICYASCSLKIRIYRESIDRYAVEFQKRGGDGIVFNAAFQKAHQHLKASGLADDDGAGATMKQSPDIGFTLPPLPVDESEEAEKGMAHLAPVLDMASMSSEPSLQAESAAALAGIADRGHDQAVSLCNKEVFQAIHKLVQCDLVDAVFSTYRLLLCLAACHQAKPFFADEEFLQLLRDKASPEKQACSAPFVHLLQKVLDIVI